MAGLVNFLAKNCSKDHEPVVSESRFDRAGHYAVSAIQGISTYDIGGSTLYMSPVHNNRATSVMTALGRKTLHAPADIENDWIGFANLPHNVIAKAVTFSRLGQPTLLPFEMVGTFADSDGGFRGVGIVVTNNYQGNPSYGAGVHNQDIKDLLFPSIEHQHEHNMKIIMDVLNLFYDTLASRSGKASPWRRTPGTSTNSSGSSEASTRRAATSTTPTGTPHAGASSTSRRCSTPAARASATTSVEIGSTRTTTTT